MSKQHKQSRGPSQRQLRVGELIRHELAALFTRGDVIDPVIEKLGVSVLEVSASPDLRQATAYVRPFQMGGDQKALEEALARNKKFIRGALAPKLQLKYMPELHFRSDTTLDYAGHIDDLLRQPAVARDLGPRDDEG